MAYQIFFTEIDPLRAQNCSKKRGGAGQTCYALFHLSQLIIGESEEARFIEKNQKWFIIKMNGSIIIHF